MTTGEKAAGRPRRRWFQFSVRSVLIAMTLFGVWFGLRMDRARRQQKAVVVLRERGNVLYESHFQGPGLSARFGKPAPWGPKWLRAIVGDDFFDRVRAVRLTESPNDDDLAYLRDLPDVESLIISSTHVTGKGIEQVRGLTSLKELILSRNQMTDADLARLEPLQELRYLSCFCSMSDKAVDSLAALKNLEELHISNVAAGSTGARAAFALGDSTVVNTTEQPLVSVLDYLMDYHGIALPVDEEVVRRAGIDWFDLPITASISGKNLEETLDVILEGTKLDWILTPDGILITTREKAADKLAAVRKLKRRLPNLKKVVCCVEP